MLYKIASNANVSRLWTYSDFAKEANAKILKYETDGNIIFSVTISADTSIPQQLLNDYEFVILNINYFSNLMD